LMMPETEDASQILTDDLLEMFSKLKKGAGKGHAKMKQHSLFLCRLLCVLLGAPCVWAGNNDQRGH
jgi:hypothetical protein